MSALRIVWLLSISLLTAPVAWAETPFVTQLRLPARDAMLDVFAWRDGSNVTVSRADLERLGITAPGEGERVALHSVPDLSYTLDESSSAVILDCGARCFAVQNLQFDRARRDPVITTTARGAYVNYDVETQWTDEAGLTGAAIAESSFFGEWGVVNSSWLGHQGSFARLDTNWTIDRPRQHLRFRFGDTSAESASGAFVRFGGVQIGRRFELEPSLITYPTATLEGEASSASMVELYVDGALRAREHVEAGPFAFDETPLVSGAGEAELVLTDIAGRQYAVTRSFFVSTALLRPGLTDWMVSAGALRLGYGERSADYGDTFFAARYRAGVTRALTLDGALESTRGNAAVQAGATAAHVGFGQLRLSRAQGESGGATTLQWLRPGRLASFGVLVETRDRGFLALGRDQEQLRSAYAANVSFDLGSAGAVSATAGQVTSAEASNASTFALEYAPRFAFASISTHLIYTDRDNSELAFGVSLSFSLQGDRVSTFGYSRDDRGPTYRASAQRSPRHADGYGWRARSLSGARQRLEYHGQFRGQTGDTAIGLARTSRSGGMRVQRTGSIGVIEGHMFAARPIHGAFALVDAGAEAVTVSRDRLRIGATGKNGRVIATGLRPYDSNQISISPDDLPFDRAPATTERLVAPADGAGVVVRFAAAEERVTETSVVFAGGEPPARGSVLVRRRDGARFPVGSGGRVVLVGGENGDVLALAGNDLCTATVGASSRRLVLGCAMS